MSYSPQYGLWSRDTLSNASGVTYNNSGEYEIRGGLAKLIPSVFESGTYSFNAPWDPVTGWTITNTLDSKTIIEQNFAIYKDANSSNGHIGSSYNTAFYTSGDASCIVYQLEGQPENITVEVDVRSLVSTGLSTGFYDSDYSYHGIIFQETGKYSFIEVHPEGLKLYGISGAVLPGNFADGLRKVRLVKEGDDIAIMSYYDEHVVYINSGMQTFIPDGAIPGGQESYIAFGSIPWTTAPTYSGATTGEFLDHADAPLIFSGQSLWDNIKIATGQAVTKHPSDYIPPYPAGTKSLTTDSWKPSNNITKYHGAFIDVVGATGGTTEVNVEYLVPSNDNLSGDWTTASATYVNSLSIPAGPDNTYFLSLANLEVFPKPFENKIRFNFQATSAGGQAPMIDTVTVAAVGGLHHGKVSPNWKLNTVPKEIFFTPDKQHHENSIPPVHYQDLIYFHNEANLSSLSAGSYITPDLSAIHKSGLVSGTTIASAPAPLGLTRITDGVHGDAWRNFNYVTGYSGEWSSQNVYETDLSGTYKGQALEIYKPYPPNGIVVSGGADVLLSIYEYTDFNDESQKAQRVFVQNYNNDTIENEDTSSWAGVYMSGINIPTATYNQFGIVEGTIHIPRGPGVTVALHEGNDTSTVLLRGDNYRTPTKFSCAIEYTGDHSSDVSNTYVSFGVLPRTGIPPILYESFTGNYKAWHEPVLNEREDEFILFNVTGYLCDHSYINYTGIDGSIRRTNFGLSGSSDVLAYLNGMDVNLDDIEGLNELLIASGITPYAAPDRNSILFEGWFRPYGFNDTTETESILVDLLDESSNGISVYLNNEGRIRHETSISYPVGTTGGLGTGAAEYSIITGDSSDTSIIWGEWNHIGVCLEQAAIGDGVNRSSYPNVPLFFNNRNILHGMRISRLYLTLNDKIVSNIDIAGDPYIGLSYLANEIDAGGYPPRKLYTSAMPRSAKFQTDSNLTARLGHKFFCDMDHVRISIRDRSDVMSDVFTYGGKYTAGIFPDRLMPKTFFPIETGQSHWEMTHILPFDYGIKNYQLFDWGFGASHALVKGAESLTGTSELDYYQTFSDFFTVRVPGISLNRQALRIGPGSRIELPWSSTDERFFNGADSYDISGNKLQDSASHPELSTYISNVALYNERTSNSHLRMCTWVRPNVFPTSGVMDIMTLDEDPNNYGLHQIYLGIDTGGNQVVGTRLNYANEIGPFTGSQLTLGKWDHIGIDTALRDNIDASSNEAFMKAYFNGEALVNQELSIYTGNALSVTGGIPFGYGGTLNDTTFNKSVYRIGGDLPRDDQAYDWTFRYGDFDVQDSVIGYGIQFDTDRETTQWNWTKLATGKPITGFTEIFNVNGETLGYTSGSVAVASAVYPATPYEDTGEQYLFFTVNGGNDYEGLLQRGMALSSPALFRNAKSYYAIYENDQNAALIGSTDSPIQIGHGVPLEGVNLALVNISPWQLENSVATFDMSDSTYANITSKVNGDTFAPAITGLNSMVAKSAIDSDSLRVASYPLYNLDETTTDLAYFAHLIGKGSKGIYIPKAESHLSASTGNNIWFDNLNKIKEAVTLSNSNGEPIEFTVFPYDLKPSPYKPTLNLEVSTGNYFGIQGLVKSKALDNGTYSVLLLSSRRTIGDSVFINYPSIDYNNGIININDSEIYNPIPLMRKEPNPGNTNTETSLIQTGFYSVNYGVTETVYDVNIWHANTGNLTGDNQLVL